MFSNMSTKETWRLYGNLTEQQVEDLLEKEAIVEKALGVEPYIKEAMGQFPAEDFLSGVTNRLHELAKKVRGDNKGEVLAIIEQLDDIAQCTFNAADYGRSELRNALKEMK